MIEFKVNRKIPQYHDNLSNAEIARKTGIHVERNANYVVPGVYLPVWRYQYFPKTKNIADGQGRRVCTILTRLDFEVGLTQDIYVSSDFKRGSCYYDVIRNHEIQHSHFDSAALDDFLVYAKQDLLDLFKRRNRYSSRDQVKKVLADRVEILLQRFRDDRKRRHATIDKGGDHNFAFDRCGGQAGQGGPMRMGPSSGGLKLF